MFKKPFSFHGRIGRLEYILSYFIVSILSQMMAEIIASRGTTALLILYIPAIWFAFAQGVKRSHDLGDSGWWVLVPFCPIWLTFLAGKKESNKYGEIQKK